MGFIEEKEAYYQRNIQPLTLPDDFEAFWRSSVERLRAVPLTVSRERLKTPYDKTFFTDLVTFSTHDKTVGTAYFSWPVHADGPVPAVVHYHGGSGTKDIFPDIVSTGVACFSAEARGQGGLTLDRADYDETSFNGLAYTKNIFNRDTFYQMNLCLDAIRAVDVVSTFPEIDPKRIVTYGGSQGGTLSVVAAALSGKVCKAFSLEPSWCSAPFRLARGSGVFKQYQSFLKSYPEYTDQVLDVLRYFDLTNMATILHVPTWFALSTADELCPPETVYSCYHYAACEKHLMILPFAPHGMHRLFKEFSREEFANL